ncbi:MAG: hypothetical protein IH872_03680 [Chloroflexi bacterium]|nr:hypothetical protein [Chloroflexota bacterium]
MTSTKLENNRMSVAEIAKNLNDAGLPPEFGEDNSRFLIKMFRTLAQGGPVTQEMTAKAARESGISYEAADQFLRQMTERDSNDNIIGLMGLSLNQDWAHRLTIGDRSFRTWCAWDTLFLPAILGEEVMVESDSPVSGETVRLTVTPNEVLSVSPEGAVVSIATLDPEADGLPSVEAIWGNFCHQVFFFPSMEEASEWARGKSNIELVSVAEGFELGKLVLSELLGYAE